MKVSLAQAGRMLMVLGSLASLVGFVFLPFGLEPLRFISVNGIQLLQYYGHLVPIEITDSNGPGASQIPALLLTYASLWAILIIFTLILLLTVFLIIRRKSSIALPIVCLVLSLLAMPGLFLAFAYFSRSSGGWDMLPLMFANRIPIVSLGWWVSLGGLLVTLTASVLAIIRHRVPARSSSAGWSTPAAAGSNSGLSSRPSQ